MNVNNSIFEGLNADQEKAVKHLFGPCCIIAGPGSGKSFCVVRKIAHAIFNGIDPSSIILFTFTTKAANEIRERVEGYIGEKASLMTIGTYHSVCVRILRQYIDRLGYQKNFTILDTEDTHKILTELCKGTDLDARSVMSYISTQKRQMISYQTALQNGVGINAKRAEVYRAYELRLRSQNGLDFDNLIALTVKLLQEHQEVREKIHRRYNYIVADESQDSSPMDLELIRLLLNEHNNLTMVGDFDQSIYSFRGTDVNLVVNFIKRLEHSETFVLNQNYRSSQTIVKASRTLIDKNTKLDDKHLFSLNEVGDKIIYAEEASPQAEAKRIVDFIHLMQKEQYNVPYKEIMILYRTNAQSVEIEKALLRYNLPYRLLGHISFYSRKEIKDILSYLRFAFNPFDYEAFKRAIDVPKRGVGAATTQKIYDYACMNSLDILTALDHLKELKLAKKATEALTSFKTLITVLRNTYLFLPPHEALAYLLNTIHYEECLKDDDEKVMRLENIAQLQELVITYGTLQELLEQSSLLSEDKDAQADDNRITLMTMHASKGLEAECVIIAGCNEEVIPFVKAIEADNIEEERRLAYVAITRARRFLFMTRSRSTLHNGRFKPMKESRFIKEIASEFLFKMPLTQAK